MNLYPYSSQDLVDFVIAGKSWRSWCEEREAVGFIAREDVWISAADMNALQSAGGSACLSVNGEIVATVGASDGCAGQTVEASSDSFLIQYVWDLMRVNEQVVSALPQDNVVIGKNCKIGPNCYLRGNTSVGDNCHIGQSVEIKNTIIGNQTNVGHLSYIGDSILGHGVNLGSGTTTSNLRHDGKNHQSVIDGELIDTGRRKFGAIIADGVHTGINTSIYPARKLGKNVTTLPAEVINGDKII